MKRCTRILVCFLAMMATLSSSGLLAQSSRAHPQTKHVTAYSSPDKEQVKVEAKLKAKAEAQQKQLSKQEVKVQRLWTEMAAHQDDPAYDMAASLYALRKLGVMYPLENFDPSFPVVYETGEKATDKQQLKQAYKAWQQAQK